MDSKLQIAEIWKFVKQLRVEPLMFLLMTSTYLRNSIGPQLVQDKICITQLYQPPSVCFNVTSSGDRAYEDIKDDILKTSNDYSLYGTLISTLPSLIFTMFLGSWSDRFPYGQKLMMYAGGVGLLLDLVVDMINAVFFSIPTAYTLLSSLPSMLAGGQMAVHTAINSHIVNTTPKDTRALRFAVLEIMFGISAPVANLLPAYMLDQTPWFFPDRLRNYVGVYTVNIVAVILTILWVHYMVHTHFSPLDDEKPGEYEDLDEATPGAQEAKQYLEAPVSRIFEFGNIKKMWRDLVKVRPNGDHVKLWLLIFVQTLSTLSSTGEQTIQYQFCEKVFNWTFKKHASVKSLFAIVNLIVPMVMVPLFLKTFKMSLPVMGIIGSLFWIVALMVRGLVLTEIGFYVSLVIHIPTAITVIASRTCISNLVKANEIGSVYASICCFQVLVPLFSSLVFTRLFNATLNSSPGLVFLVTAGFMFVTFSVFVYVQITTLAKSVEPSKVTGGEI